MSRFVGHAATPLHSVLTQLRLFEYCFILGLRRQKSVKMRQSCWNTKRLLFHLHNAARYESNKLNHERTWMALGWVVIASASSDALRLNIAAITAWPSCQHTTLVKLKTQFTVMHTKCSKSHEII